MGIEGVIRVELFVSATDTAQVAHVTHCADLTQFVCHVSTMQNVDIYMSDLNINHITRQCTKWLSLIHSHSIQYYDTLILCSFLINKKCLKIF